METRANYVVVGAFVLVLLVAAAGVLLWLIGSQFNVVLSYYQVRFAGSVAGLDKDSTVRYNGVPVGKVADIALDQLAPNQVVVVVAIDPATTLRADATATLAMQGLTGGSYIEISGGSPGSPPLAHRTTRPYPEIGSRSSGLQSLFDQAPEVLTQLKDIEVQIKKALDDKNVAAITETLENVRAATGAVAKHSPQIEEILANTADATHDFDVLAKTANQTVEKAGPLVDQVGGVVGHADTLVGHADKFVGGLNATIEENRPGLHEFTSRGLNGAEQLIANTNDLVLKIGRVVDELERDPSRFLFGDKNKGYQPQ
jgi:phospholipid/cholesterol/gamma-HCH transport system substrate-binding protein